MTILRSLSAAAALLCLAAAAPPLLPAAAGFPNVPGRANATPSIAAEGSLVAVAWGATLAGKADVFAAVSRDGGASFGPAVLVNAVPGEARLNGEMPPRIALAAVKGSSSPDIVVLWTARGAATEIKSARSRDGGKTFEAPVVLQSAGAAGDRGWPALALDRSGRAHAVWLDHRGLAAARAANGGRSGHQPGTAHDGVAMAQSSGIYYASPGGSGAAERKIAKGVCYCCKTALAIGADDTIYAAWRHVYPGSFRDMAFTSSRDGGRTFAAPVRVAEDGWAIDACPDDGPAMAVDGNGAVHVVWPTVIGGDRPEGAIFYAVTRDGQRFTPKVRVATLGGLKPSHPQIVVDARQRVFVAWDESSNGRQTAALREVRIGANGTASFGRTVTLSPAVGAIYPAVAAAGSRVMAAWSTGGARSQVQVRALDLP
jgi:hypothetical protein